MKTLKLIVLLLLLGGLGGCKTQNTVVQEKPQTETVAVDQPKSVNIRGEEFHYIEKGSGDPLIFIHGTLGDYRVWIPRVEEYSKNFKVIAYSRRYAYPNKKVFDQAADYSVRIHADDLYALINELDLKNVNIVGHSYGAFTALFMALEHPEVVNALVLGEPPAASLAQNTEKGRASWSTFLDDYLRPAKQDFQMDNNEAALVHFLQGVLGDDFSLAQVPPEVKQGWMDNLSELRGVAINEDFPTLKETDIKSLDIPVLLLVGDISPGYLIEISNELHRLLPKSEIVRFENMNHGLYFENPEAVDKALVDFLMRN